MLKASLDSIHTEHTTGGNVISFSICRLLIIVGVQKVHGQSGPEGGVAFFLQQISNGFLIVNGSRFHRFRKRIFLRSENLPGLAGPFFPYFATSAAKSPQPAGAER